VVKHPGSANKGTLEKQAKNHLGEPIFEDLGHGRVYSNDLTTMLVQLNLKARCRRPHTDVVSMAAP
jgi:hypothetical protein